MNHDDLVGITISKIKKLGNEQDKVQMIAYMKNHFDFFGVKSPPRKEVQKELKVFWKEMDSIAIFSYAESLWNESQRELQYVALAALEYRSQKWDLSYLPRIENMITSKSWWDTVDSLAPNIAGTIFRKYPEAKLEWIERWNNSDNMWLNRSALIHQLRYKEEVNLDLLFALVESHIHSKEFFINKASGWALRQASKYYPAEIKSFIDSQPNLPTLTRREGSKYV